MSAEPGTISIANKGKASVWTEEAKVCQRDLQRSCSFSTLNGPPSLQYELLLRIIHQLKRERTINWSAINMKDRNSKSLTNQWTKMGKDMAALEGLDGETGGATPTPKKGAGKFSALLLLSSDFRKADSTRQKPPSARPPQGTRMTTRLLRLLSESEVRYISHGMYKLLPKSS